MNKGLCEELDVIKNKYQEAFYYLEGGDILHRNPERAFSVFNELSDEGFVSARFFVGFMLLAGIGTEKNVDRGKKMMKDQEKYLDFPTEVFIAEKGLYGDLSTEEKLNYIEYLKNNHQVARAFYLKAHI